MKADPQAFFSGTVLFFSRNKKVLRRLCLVLLVCLAVILCGVVATAAVRNYRLNRQVNTASAEISLLIRNITAVYAAEEGRISDLTKALIKTGTVYADKNGTIKNYLGGDIALIMEYPEDLRPFFILSYRGLPRDVCVKLSGLNWGDSQTGLMTEAVGSTDAGGEDSALKNLNYNAVREEAVKDKDGQIRYIRTRPQEILTAASPDDVYTVYPLPEDFALTGCSCGKSDDCSFVLQYSFYPEH